MKMASDYQKAFKKWGVSATQHYILANMKDGEIRYDQARGNIQQLHRLTDKGMLEYAGDQTWRLTSKGRELIDSWSDS